MNNQIIVKQQQSTDPLLVHSIFPTLQGEGPYVGQRAIFVRLWGCNLQCPMCDTDYTITKTPMEPSAVIDAALQATVDSGWKLKHPHSHKPLIVITGGEPLRQNLQPLIRELRKFGFPVQIETNGTLFDSSVCIPGVAVVCSPKTGKVVPALHRYIRAYKYVLHADQVDPEDGLPIRVLDHSAAPRVARPHKNFKGTIYVQPVDDPEHPERNPHHLEAALRSSFTYGYTLGLQVHKILGLE